MLWSGPPDFCVVLRFIASTDHPSLQVKSLEQVTPLVGPGYFWLKHWLQECTPQNSQSNGKQCIAALSHMCLPLKSDMFLQAPQGSR